MIVSNARMILEFCCEFFFFKWSIFSHCPSFFCSFIGLLVNYSDKLFKETRDLNFEVVVQVDLYWPFKLLYFFVFVLQISLPSFFFLFERRIIFLEFNFLVATFSMIVDSTSKSNIHEAGLHWSDFKCKWKFLELNACPSWDVSVNSVFWSLTWCYCPSLVLLIGVIW